jgi:outer membrane protein OmpA-like peptidoglycan-associated protein
LLSEAVGDMSSEEVREVAAEGPADVAGHVRAETEAALAGEHDETIVQPVLTGPATDAQLNTLRPPLVPVACFRLEEVVFDFDSSFLLPGMRGELAELKTLIDDHPGAPPSIFAHADPVGNDEYNKALSGRRAQAVYALLVRKPELWEELHTKGDWTDAHTQQMLEAIGFPPGRTDGVMDEPAREAVRTYQKARGLPPDERPGPQTRKSLHRDYMDFLCIGPDGKPFTLSPRDFLARGDDPRGKGDYQGCSEFNPILLLSQGEKQKFERDKDKTDRDLANRPNRRVVVYFFPPLTRVEPAKWPCPRAIEGTSACRKRFWSDHTRRIANGPERREFRLTRDTFACRFYHRFAERSPCETALGKIRVPLVFDDALLGPSEGIVVQLTFADGTTQTRTTDRSGTVRIDAERGAFADARYERQGFEYTRRVFVRPPAPSTEAGAWQRLVNLGYVTAERPGPSPATPVELAHAVEEFQFDFRLDVTGELDAKTSAKIREAHDRDGRPWPKRDWAPEPTVDPSDPNTKQQFS